MTEDPLAAWKAAIATQHKQQRQRRGCRRNASRRIGPGMIRVPSQDASGDGDGDDGQGGDDG